MNNTEKLDAATSLLNKLTGGYFHFEEWPEGDGFLMLDGSTDLTAAETRFLSTIKKPEGASGPGGDDMPDDFADDEGLA